MSKPQKDIIPVDAAVEIIPASGSLDDLAVAINKAHELVEEARHQIGAALWVGLSHARQVGQWLLEAKAKFEHGDWLPWLKDNVKFSVRTAQLYMQVVRQWPKVEAEGQMRNGVACLSLHQIVRLLAGPENEADVSAGEPVAEPSLNGRKGKRGKGKRGKRDWRTKPESVLAAFNAFYRQIRKKGSLRIKTPDLVQALFPEARNGLREVETAIRQSRTLSQRLDDMKDSVDLVLEELKKQEQSWREELYPEPEPEPQKKPKATFPRPDRK